MKARFVGGANGEGGQFIVAYGVRFGRKHFVEVPEEAREKIAGNGHFEVRNADNGDENGLGESGSAASPATAGGAGGGE